MLRITDWLDIIFAFFFLFSPNIILIYNIDGNETTEFIRGLWHMNSAQYIIYTHTL